VAIDRPDSVLDRLAALEQNNIGTTLGQVQRRVQACWTRSNDNYAEALRKCPRRRNGVNVPMTKRIAFRPIPNTVLIASQNVGLI
jgi:hypothetical protein